MIEFSQEDYRLAGHLEPWYEFYSGLDFVDQTTNPYGFSASPVDDIDTSYAFAKSITRLYLERLMKSASSSGDR